MNDQTEEDTTRQVPPEPESENMSPDNALAELGAVISGLLRNSAALFATDARLALQTVVILLISALILGILALSIWLYIGAALGLILADVAGWPGWAAALAAALFNLLTGAALALWLRTLIKDLGFHQSRAALAEALGRPQGQDHA